MIRELYSIPNVENVDNLTQDQLRYTEPLHYKPKVIVIERNKAPVSKIESPQDRLRYTEPLHRDYQH
jgi:hypothetical protein